MKRRHFIQITAAGTLALSLPNGEWSTAAPSRLHALAAPSLLDIVGDERRIRAIGLAYRGAFPREDSPDVLVTAMLREGRMSPRLPQAVLRDRLDRQVRQDFERGHTVRVDGWILSRTEARQCALFSILHS